MTTFHSDWTPVSKKPPNGMRVLIWHRVRPWCRYFQPTVGWWNGVEWRADVSHFTDKKVIYQPTMWKFIDPPPSECGQSWESVHGK